MFRQFDGRRLVGVRQFPELVPAPGTLRRMNPTHHTPLLAAALAALAAAPTLAQNQAVVVPNGYENLECTSAARTPFGWSSGRVQYFVDGEQLCSAVAILTNLQFRLDGGNFNIDAPLGKSFQATLVAYEVPTAPGAMSNQWANNIGSATGTTIYSGPLNVPPAVRQYPYPNPWTIDIALPVPFFYQRANGNLLLDLTVTGGSGDNWPADGFFFHGTEARGEVTRIWEDASCTNGRGDTLSLNVPQVFGNGVLGGQLQVNHTATAAGSGSIDFVYHFLGLDNQQSNSQPLPVALLALGYPGCQQNVDPLLGQLVPSSAGQCLWTLPGAPSLVGLPLFSQAVGFDLANGLAVPARNAWQTRIGSPVPLPAPAQMVHQSNFVNQTGGALSPTGFYGLVIRFLGTFV